MPRAMPPNPRPGGKINVVAPGLYLVATPIGNLRDITLRALDVLAGVDLVLAEDTRVTGKLLAAHGVSAKLRRFDDHAAEAAVPEVLSRLAGGARIALVSDAGTPLISDPGYRLVRAASGAGARVVPVPGASASLAALTVSGLPTDRFLFAGFPPARAGPRRAFFDGLRGERATLVLFETGPRLTASLSAMAEAFGARAAAVARELTKLHETVVRGDLAVLAADPRLAGVKGEIVVVVAGAGNAEPAGAPIDLDAWLADALERLKPAAAAALAARQLGVGRKDAYARALALRSR